MPKKTQNNSSMIIRIPKAERDAFVELCEELDSSASRELRLYIRKFLKKNKKKKKD